MLIFGLAGQVPVAAWNIAGDLLGHGRAAYLGEKTRRGVRAMARSQGFDALLDSFLDSWAMAASPMAGGIQCSQKTSIDPRLSLLPLERQVMQADAVTYLPDDILCKIDRAAMAVSLESRVPFLDPEVTSLAARISPELLFRRSGGKHILKELLATMVPRELFERPKAGFDVPIGEWVKGPLRDWSESLLDEKSLAEGGLLDPVPIRERWQDHLAGREDAAEALWPVLMFQAWRAAPASPASP
jgi:asparagine synthase (glutamine-hydrolysing)